jgi:hypothetical protein
MDNTDGKNEWLPKRTDTHEPDPSGSITNPSSQHDSREMFPWGLPGSYRLLPVRRGRLRSDFSTLSVETDAEAVAAWIAEKASRSANTAQSYRREAE